MNKSLNKFIYWTPRILSIIFILFLAVFSLDVFDMGLSGWQIVVGLFMHNIPVFILLIVLLISWKHEIVGGVVFILAGLAYSGMAIARGVLSSGLDWRVALSWSLTIAVPAFLVGVLFLVGWAKKRTRKYAP